MSNVVEYSKIIDEILSKLPLVADSHAVHSDWYQSTKEIVEKEIKRLFSDATVNAKKVGNFGNLNFPYQKMGAIDSVKIFNLDELIIFSFYWANRHLYKNVADIGANIGLHSIMLNKCGFQIQAYEPDVNHYKILQRNLQLNHCESVKPFNMAVSSQRGEIEFVRVLGNTTASHVAGAKPNPYGELEKYTVQTEAFKSIISWADLLKIDIEGHEKEILLTTDHNDWLSTDALVEVDNFDNAMEIYKYFTNIGVNLFAQKINWQLVKNSNDMPTSYKEGTLFISCKDKMPWNDTKHSSQS